MVAWVVIDRQHLRQTSPSFFPCSNSHFGTHPALIPEEIIPFFSCTYVEPILQPLCFHIHACNGGGYPLPKLPTFQRVSELSPFFSHSCALFCTSKNHIPILIKNFHTLCEKHPAWGAPAERKQAGGGGVPRRGGRFRRNSSTADSRNSQLFLVEKFLPNVSSALFITASPRRRFLLRTMRKTSQKPGGSFSSAFAAPASASGTATANFSSNSGSMAPMILVMIKRLRMPRIASGVFVASTTISRILLPPSSTPRSNSRTPRSWRPCSTSKPASTASACSIGACSSRERSSSRGSRLGNSRGIGRAMGFLLAFSSFESARARYQACGSLCASTSAPPRRRAGALGGRSGGLCAAAGFRRFPATRGDERKPLCTRACASLRPCGCWSSGSQDSRPNSWACRVLYPALCRSPARAREAVHSVKSAAPTCRFEFRALPPGPARLRQRRREFSREILRCGRSCCLRENVRAAARYSDANRTQRWAGPSVP